MTQGLNNMLMRILQLGLLANLVGCFPSKPETSSPSSSAAAPVGADGTSTLGVSDSGEDPQMVRVGVSASQNASGLGALALVSVINEATFTVQGCRSGHTQTLQGTANPILQLYRFDQDCVIAIQSLLIESSLFTPALGQPFNPTQGAISTFSNDTGKLIYVRVQSQLPAILSQTAYNVAFVVAETQEGTGVDLNVFEVGVSFNVASVFENTNSPPVLTLRRALPATGPLTININYEGTAAPGSDYLTLPATIAFADGESERTLPVSLINDSTYESGETLTVRVMNGTNYVPKEPPATLTIRDDEVALVATQFTGYNFGTRALNFAHTTKVRITNTGKAPATAMQVFGSLPPNFTFPGGFPGDGSSCTSILPANQNCDLVVAFSPIATGASSGTIVLSYFNGVENVQLSFTVQGSGGNAAYLVFQESDLFEFDTSQSRTGRKHLIVRNLGQVPATNVSGTFSSMSFRYLGNSFPGTGGSCTQSIAVGARCTVVVEFAGTGIGYFSGAFQLNYNNAFMSVSTSLALEGSVSNLLAPNLTLSTALNTSLAINLTSTGGVGAVTYQILSGPSFGTLTGTSPNFVYTPSTGFNRVDTIAYRAVDANGPSPVAQLRIYVQPKALFLVGNLDKLRSLETEIRNRLTTQGFDVFVRDDDASTTADAFGRDLIVISDTVIPTKIELKYRDVRVPAFIWENLLYDEMQMVSTPDNTTGNFNGHTINIVTNNHPITAGYALGNLRVFSLSAPMDWINESNANTLKLATVPGDASRSLFFAYDEDNLMPSGDIAPAKRLGVFLPSTANVINPAGRTLIDRSLNWLLTNRNRLLYDVFQRDTGQTLGGPWQEFEYTGAELTVGSGQLLNQSGQDTVSAKARFSLQTSGVFTLRFYLNLKTNGSQSADAMQGIQLGRCDLMDRNLPETSGSAVNLLWGGSALGLGGEEHLGYRVGNSVSSITTLNQPSSFVGVTVDMGSSTYTVTTAAGTTAAIPFDSQVAIDCLRVTSRNINSAGFVRRGLQQIHIFEGR
jgi:hypothetical protein